jgi:hypothetical protein
MVLCNLIWPSINSYVGYCMYTLKKLQRCLGNLGSQKHCYRQQDYSFPALFVSSLFLCSQESQKYQSCS